MAGDNHSPAAASGSPSHSPPPSETLISQQSTQNDVTLAAHNQQSGIKLPSNRRRSNRKIQTLINAVNLIPFTPKLLVLRKHDNVLKRLGLYNFSKIKLDQNIRTDLIAQVIANYDPKKRSSSVNGKRVRVSRADLARALELPVTIQDINNDNLGVFSADEIEFVDDFVFNWMLIHEESWVMPEKIVKMTRCVRDGHPEKLDSASLIWYKVERELGLGVKLVDCYYASHLQWLIWSQCEQLFEVDDEVKEHIEKVADVELTLAHETVDSENTTGEELLKHCQTSDLNNNEEVKVEEGEDDGERKEKVSIVQEDDAELTLGDTTMGEQVDLNKNLGEQVLQRCQASDSNNNEVNVEDVVDKPIAQVEAENNDDDVENFVEGLDMEANDDGIDVTGSPDDLFMSHGGPSLFDNNNNSNNNNGKRVMESEDDTHHLDMNNKRLKTDAIWDHKQSEFGLCMMQMDQWIEKAKMITDSKEQDYANRKHHQDSTLYELQHHQQVMEMIIKSKDEELGQKDAEVYRLQRELYLMVDLLKGYRTALNDECIKFSDYRKRVSVQQKSDFKDVGPGGLVLSTRDLEEVVSNDADVAEEKGGGEEH